MALGGNGIYCIVDTFTKVGNLVIELKSHIIALHPIFDWEKCYTFDLPAMAILTLSASAVGVLSN